MRTRGVPERLSRHHAAADSRLHLRLTACVNHGRHRRGLVLRRAVRRERDRAGVDVRFALQDVRDLVCEQASAGCGIRRVLP